MNFVDVMILIVVFGIMGLISWKKFFSKNAIFFVTNLRFLRLTGEITKERLVDTWIRIPQKSYMKPFI